MLAPSIKAYIDPDEYLDLTEKELDVGNNTLVLPSRSQPQTPETQGVESSIPQAEIESSAPYQPFHTDRRVGLYEYGAAANQQDAVPAPLEGANADNSSGNAASRKKIRRQQKQDKTGSNGASDVWVFGQPIQAAKLDLGVPLTTDEETYNYSIDESRALPASEIERVLHHIGENDEQIVVTTRRRRKAGRAAEPDDDGFFEDDCEVLDFADQRV
jgi:hypothetical protein